MDELIAQARSLLRAMWRRRWAGLATFAVACAVGALVLTRVPDRFEASARVYVDTKSVLKPLLRDLTVSPDIDQTLQLLAKILITRPNVEALGRKTGLITAEMTPIEQDRVVDRLTRQIKIASVGRDNVFSFSYRDVDRVQARQLVEQLVQLFVASDLGDKMRDTDAARQFIDQQIKTYEGRLTEAENRLKDFRLRNLWMTDGSGKDYFARMTALTEELGRLNVDLRAAEQSSEALKRELSGESVSLVPDTPAIPEAPVSPELDARLEAQRRQLDDLLRRFTDLHPDVVATRRLIARLEEQKAEAEARRRAEQVKAARAGVSRNPQLQQTKLALAAAEANVAALRVRVSDTQGRLNQLRADASRIPQVEAELAQLNRDYEVVRRNYEALVSQREKAQMSEDVDSTRLASFRVIDPPRTDEEPVFPGRRVLGIVVVLVGFGLAVAVTFVLAQLRPTIDTADALRALTRRPVLGSITRLESPAAVRAARLNLSLFFGGGFAVLCCYALALYVITRPLKPLM